jgi:hypothetical protein
MKFSAIVSGFSLFMALFGVAALSQIGVGGWDKTSKVEILGLLSMMAMFSVAFVVCLVDALRNKKEEGIL